MQLNNMNTDILTIQSLTKGFSRKVINSGGFDENEEYLLINQLFLNIPRGKVIALIGGNGAGKTTLFNIISGFVIPDKGSIKFGNNGNATELIGMSPHRIAKLGIGRMFQDNHTFPEMSVLENMLIANPSDSTEKPFSSLIFKKRSKENETQKLERVEKVFNQIFGNDNSLWEKRSSPAAAVSYGQQRLLGLARLFMHDYQLLLLDEPTSGVNPEVIEQIKNLIRRLSDNNQTVLLIEHNLDVVKDIADFCCYMDKGRIALMGTPADVIGNEEVRKSYIGL
jgi:ABC-type branched-subunit amino acid transport system ATPase component